MPKDYRWRVDGIEVRSLISGQPTWSVGDTTTLTFKLGTESVDGRVRDTNVYEGTLGGPAGVTMGGELPATHGAARFDTPDGSRDRDDAYTATEDTPFGELQSLMRYSGSATTEMSVDGVPMVRETIPARSDRESFIIAIEPIGHDVAWTTGAWVLVTAATDVSQVPGLEGGWLAIQLSCTVLAPLTEYDTREDLEADMAPPIFPEA